MTLLSMVKATHIYLKYICFARNVISFKFTIFDREGSHLYNDGLWRLDGNECSDRQYDLRVKGQGQPYIKPGCMYCNANSSCISTREDMFILTQY